MRRNLTAVAAALVVAAVQTAHAQGPEGGLQMQRAFSSTLTIEVKGGRPGVPVGINLNAVKTASVEAGDDGSATALVPMPASDEPSRAYLTVAKDGSKKVTVVTAGNAPPAADVAGGETQTFLGEIPAGTPRVTVDVTALTMTASAAGAGAAGAPADTHWRDRLRYEVFFAGGKSTVVGVVDRVREDFTESVSGLGLMTDFGDSSDRGLGFLAGGSVGYPLSDAVEIGLRADWRKPAAIDIDFRATRPGLEISAIGSTGGYLVGGGLELGYTFGKAKLAFGGGLQYFSLEDESTLMASFNGTTEREDLTGAFSGIGPDVFGRFQWSLTDRFALSLFASSTWLNDETVGQDFSPFDERLSLVMLGLHLGWGGEQPVSRPVTRFSVPVSTGQSSATTAWGCSAILPVLQCSTNSPCTGDWDGDGKKDRCVAGEQCAPKAEGTVCDPSGPCNFKTIMHPKNPVQPFDKCECTCQK